MSLACVEAGLAFIRESHEIQQEALTTLLTGQTIAPEGGANIRLITFMLMGFVLPLLLSIIAIPLEYLIHTGRVMAGALLEVGLRILAFFLRIAAALARQLGNLMVQCYDMLIVGPLWIEKLIEKNRQTSSQAKSLAIENSPRKSFATPASLEIIEDQIEEDNGPTIDNDNNGADGRTKKSNNKTKNENIDA